MNDILKAVLGVLSIIVIGAIAYQDLRSDVDMLNKYMDRQEIARDLVLVMKGDVSNIKEQVLELKQEQRQIKLVLDEVNKQTK